VKKGGLIQPLQNWAFPMRKKVNTSSWFTYKTYMEILIIKIDEIYQKILKMGYLSNCYYMENLLDLKFKILPIVQ